ncbi:MAG: hypothetical protein WC781_00855 [Candidatus Pacearchaeota archaeon]|jgi:hypothetical protein
MSYIKGLGKESEIIDYTDGGKNIPEIKSDYRMTKEGFIEFKGKSETVSQSATSSESSDANSGFDFLNNMAMGSTSNVSSSFNIGSENLDNSEIKKQLRSVTSMAEQNSNEVYRLLQRIEILEKKIEILEGMR